MPNKTFSADNLQRDVYSEKIDAPLQSAAPVSWLRSAGKLGVRQLTFKQEKPNENKGYEVHQIIIYCGICDCSQRVLLNPMLRLWVLVGRSYV